VKASIKQVLGKINILFFNILGFFLKKEVRELTMKNTDNVIVFSPHADDETIGCGITMKRHSDAGGKVTIVNITDGGRSKTNTRQKDVKEVRRRELFSIARKLKAKEIHFLGFPDRELADHNEELQEKLYEVLQTNRPNIIYVPFFCDFHIDHVMTNVALEQALSRLCFPVEIRCYEVQVPMTSFIFNGYTEITKDVEWKNKLISVFASQTLSFENILLSWRINGKFLKNAKYAEVFFCTDVQQYIWLVRQFLKEPKSWSRKFYASGSSAKLLITYCKGLRLRIKIKKSIKRPLQQ
jgi:LmbE family N-acetylglucosaminyl deacetylase